MTTHQLYKQDYVLWLEKTAQLLRERQLSQLDLPNLLEEIEDMGRSENRAVESNLEVLLIHLLKYQYQPQNRSNSWRYTIFEHRDRLQKAFRDSPSLKSYFEQIYPDCYATARIKAAIETELSIETFPLESPFSVAAIQNPDYLPGND